MWLFNELELARIQDGSNAALLEHFLALLRSTGCHIILAETSTPWKEIRSHHRLPNHMSQPLPWTLNQILCDLETAKVMILHSPPSSSPSSITPTALASITPSLPLPEAYAVMNQRQHHQRHPMNITNNNISRPPPTASITKTNKCLLCNNQHLNPWHSTEQFSFKDPTYIHNKLIRDNVMHHNTLYGRINKNYTKSSPSPSSITTPIHHPQHNIAKLADLQLPTLDEDSTPTDSVTHEIPELSYHYILDHTPSQDTTNETTQCIDTQYFEIPTPMANFTSSTIPTSSPILEPIDTSDLLFDPLQYLHFSS
jgi:hypothetical protein